MLKFNSYYVVGLKIIYNFVDVKRQIDKFKSLIKPVTNQEVFPHIEELTNIFSEEEMNEK